MIAKTSCQQCAVHIEFEAENAGEFVACPSCGKLTQLLLATAQTPIATEGKSHLYLILALVAVLALVATFILVAEHEVEHKKQIEKDSQDELKDMLNINTINADVAITVIQTVTVMELKYHDTMDEINSKKQETTEIVDRDILLLRQETADEITSWKKKQDLGLTRTLHGDEKINSWEKQMEQNILGTALEAKKHGATAQDVEDAIILTLQLKQTYPVPASK